MPKQFLPVSCTYGAPMGRQEYGKPEDCAPRSVSLFRVRLLGDYDDGGAYWGAPIHGAAPLYCARDTSGAFRRFARAWTRAEAAYEMRLVLSSLARSVDFSDLPCSGPTYRAKLEEARAYYFGEPEK